MGSGVSVIVCCYNSSLRLPETLAHIQNQKVSGINWEVIVVDNASSDDTSAAAKRILSAGNQAVDFTIVSEPESGLSTARKRGYLTSKYELLIFCDDDNWLADNYVQLASEIMEKNPAIGILGGFGEAVFESKEPAWFKKYQIDFAVGDQSSSPQNLSHVQEVYGAGFTIRKNYLDQLYGSGFKSILSDRKGNQLISGGDVELCYLAKYFGYEIWYSRDLKFKHLMTAPRLSWQYMKRLYAGSGTTNIYTFAYKFVIEHNRVPNQNLRLPFWLDTFIHRVKYIFSLRSKVKGKMEVEGDADVLRYIALKAEAREIWALKEKYSALYQTIYLYLNQIKK
ncbi:MAG: family 2 glycosyl transferase [Bacteroidota bacterium]|nr:family 2 glycosyl transferase [Bacteroidota bacterium]